jgi:hypothetical protein
MLHCRLLLHIPEIHRQVPEGSRAPASQLSASPASATAGPRAEGGQGGVIAQGGSCRCASCHAACMQRVPSQVVIRPPSWKCRYRAQRSQEPQVGVLAHFDLSAPLSDSRHSPLALAPMRPTPLCTWTQSAGRGEVGMEPTLGSWGHHAHTRPHRESPGWCLVT